MQEVVTILHLEDDPLDAELVQETIKQEGFVPNIIRVDTEEGFRREIHDPRIELILADYVLPQI
jgi:DNA-binding response OmpR family regulator